MFPFKEFFFGTLPVLEIDGQKHLAQSAAILRYFGEKYGSKNNFHRALKIKPDIYNYFCRSCR
jgi:glutathione S-transferase